MLRDHQGSGPACQVDKLCQDQDLRCGHKQVPEAQGNRLQQRSINHMGGVRHIDNALTAIRQILEQMLLSRRAPMVGRSTTSSGYTHTACGIQEGTQSPFHVLFDFAETGGLCQPKRGHGFGQLSLALARICVVNNDLSSLTLTAHILNTT